MVDRERQQKLRKILKNQYQELIKEIQKRKRELRAEKTTKLSRIDDEDRDGRSGSDGVVESVQDSIEIFLIKAKVDALHKVEDTLDRLEKGEYGNCSECGEKISKRRLQALPFAVRCRDCEEARENELSRLVQQRRTYPFA